MNNFLEKNNSLIFTSKLKFCAISFFLQQHGFLSMIVKVLIPIRTLFGSHEEYFFSLKPFSLRSQPDIIKDSIPPLSLSLSLSLFHSTSLSLSLYLSLSLFRSLSFALSLSLSLYLSTSLSFFLSPLSLPLSLLSIPFGRSSRCYPMDAQSWSANSGVSMCKSPQGNFALMNLSLSRVQHLLIVLLGWFMWWEASGCTAAVL